MDEFLDKLLQRTDRKLSFIERMLYNAVIGYLIDNITYDDKNKITLTNNNTRAIGNINKSSEKLGSLWGDFIRFVTGGVLDYFKKGLKDFLRFDVSAIEKSKDTIEKLEKQSSTTANKVLSLEIIFSDIKSRAILLMSRPDGITLKELRKELEVLIVDKSIAKRYYQRWTHDIYSQYQRIATNEVRKELGLNFAFYQGGLIGGSRRFCRDRNGKIFHESEILSWANLDWQGKQESGYNPIADLGGYNCRHRLDWISDELAFRLRPDLKEQYENV